MDGGRGGGGGVGSCCIARPAAVAADREDISKAHRIMRKFRPIAPKPAVVGHVAEPSTVIRGGRKRRRYRRSVTNSYADKTIKEPKRSKPSSSSTSPNSELGLTVAAAALTLPLLPENNRVITPKPPLNMVASIVTVESLTDTWVEEYGLGYTDVERMNRLNVDTCPGFVSDGFGRVIWTNGAYREMVGGGGEVVSLMIKEEDQRVLMICGAAFTCRVRLQYYGCRSMTIPCDAWRMDCGGFAWRLDMKAALSL